LQRVGAWLRRRGESGLVGLGLALAAVALLDRRQETALLAGPLLALGGWAWGGLARGDWERRALPAWLAVAFAVAALVKPEFRADSGGYYSYLRSAFFDGDFDFANEWRTWGYAEAEATATGLRPNPYSVGPAILWSPFFATAHLYVTTTHWLGTPAGNADGFSAPYYHATAAGTLTVGLIGAWLLAKTLSRRLGAGPAAIGVGAAILASSPVYYLFVMPTMAHGLVFGLASAAVWAWDRAEREPSLRTWLVLGGLVGLLALTRWQCAVYGLLVLPLALEGLVRRRVRPTWLAAAALAAAVAFVPQMLAWKVLYGAFLTVPQEPSFFLSGPVHAVDVLFHADHGLFPSTPAMMLASLGLLLSLRAWPLLALGGCLVFVATVWVNGSIVDWHGSDSFGSRRFDLVMPFMALGLARLVGLLLRVPLLAGGLLLLVPVLWNLGLVGIHRKGVYLPALDRIAERQMRQLYELTDRALGNLAGAAGRSLAYRFFVGEYVYYNLASDGTIDLASPESARFLADGWSAPRRGDPAFRWAYGPEACFSLPFDRPQDLRATLIARTPQRLDPQQVTITVNGASTAGLTLTSDWAESAFVIPGDRLASGRNSLCLQFARSLDEEEGRVAAAVARLQLP
jgi:hypothetical protein